jgi:lipid-A-disaccharide synthase
MSDKAIMGFIDAIKNLSFLRKLNNDMLDLVGTKQIDKVLLMDSSGFNLPLAKKIKAQYPHVEIIYYILPQAWAWRRGRIKVIESVCDKLCSILPFEKNYYSQKDKINYVGHPLLDEIKVYKDENKVYNQIAFMPGSRKTEIRGLMPIYRELITKIDKKPILIIPSSFKSKSDEELKQIYGDISSFEISYSTYETLPKVDFAFICSGTATLESAIIGTPFLLCYIAKKFDYFIGKNLVKIEYVGLANIFFKESDMRDKYGAFHKEFVQDDVTIDNLLEAYNNQDNQDFLIKSNALKEYLQNGSSQNVANIILDK